MDGPDADMLGNGRADFGQEKESQWKYRGHDHGLHRGMPGVAYIYDRELSQECSLFRIQSVKEREEQRSVRHIRGAWVPARKSKQARIQKSIIQMESGVADCLRSNLCITSLTLTIVIVEDKKSTLCRDGRENPQVIY